VSKPADVIDLMPRIPIYSPEVPCATEWDEGMIRCTWSGVAPEDGCCPWCDMPLPDRAWEFLAGA